MGKAGKPDNKVTNEQPVKVKGSFLDVFKVVKKNKEQRMKDLEKKVDEINKKK